MRCGDARHLENRMTLTLITQAIKGHLNVRHMQKEVSSRWRETSFNRVSTFSELSLNS